MRLLLDENMAPSLPAALMRHGLSADHTATLNLNRTADPIVLAFAVAHGYDAIITKDRYRKREDRLAALHAMNRGLRIIQLRFRQNAPAAGSTEAQLQLILNHLAIIEQALAPDSPIRQLILNHALGGVTRAITADQVAATLRRLEPRAADDH